MFELSRAQEYGLTLRPAICTRALTISRALVSYGQSWLWPVCHGHVWVLSTVQGRLVLQLVQLVQLAANGPIGDAQERQVTKVKGSQRPTHGRGRPAIDIQEQIIGRMLTQHRCVCKHRHGRELPSMRPSLIRLLLSSAPVP